MTFIKLEDVLDTLKRVGDEQQRPDLYAMIGFVAGLFEKTPKYEFSEQQTTVVRCKDCIHFEPNNIPEEGCGTCILLDRIFYNDNYCGYGEKVKK